MSPVAQTLTITGRAIGRWRLSVGLLLLRFAFWLMRGWRLEVNVDGKRTQTYRVDSSVSVHAEIRGVGTT